MPRAAVGGQGLVSGTRQTSAIEERLVPRRAHASFIHMYFTFAVS